MEQKNGLKLVISFSIILIALFSYLAYLHFQPSTRKFCDINDNISCDVVNKSLYSEIFRIPVAIFGTLTFFLVILLSWITLRKENWSLGKINLDRKKILILLLAVLTFSILFSVWLIYAELYLILSICILCVTADVFILAAFAVLIILNKDNINKKVLFSLMGLLFIVSIIVLYLIYEVAVGVLG